MSERIQGTGGLRPPVSRTRAEQASEAAPAPPPAPEVRMAGDRLAFATGDRLAALGEPVDPLGSFTVPQPAAGFDEAVAMAAAELGISPAALAEFLAQAASNLPAPGALAEFLERERRLSEARRIVGELLAVSNWIEAGNPMPRIEHLPFKVHWDEVREPSA